MSKSHLREQFPVLWPMLRAIIFLPITVSKAIWYAPGRFVRFTRRKWKSIVVAILILLAVHGLVTYALYWQVAAELDRIRAKGDPVCCADFLRQAVPDSENGALIYEKAFRMLRAMPSSKRKYDSQEFFERDKHPEIWGQVRRELRGYAEVFALAEEAAGKTKYRYTADWATGYKARYRHCADIRYLARLLSADAVVKARYGDMQGAAHSIEQIISLSQSLKSDPLIIGMLAQKALLDISAGATQEVCEYGRISGKQAQRICAALSAVDLDGSCVLALKGDRAAVASLADGISSRGFGELQQAMGGDYELPSLLLRFRCTWPGRPLLYIDELNCLRSMDEMIENALVPYRKYRRDEPEGSYVEDWGSDHSLHDLIIPQRDHIRAAVDRGLTSVRGTQLILALQTFSGRSGAYSASLSELEQALHWNLNLEDPFSGKEFIYKRQGGGFLLYSIGQNLKDDGGVENDSPDEGDIVWQFSH